MSDRAKPFQTVQGLKKIPGDFLLADWFFKFGRFQSLIFQKKLRLFYLWLWFVNWLNVPFFESRTNDDLETVDNGETDFVLLPGLIFLCTIL
jgi:hypothetical protein